MEWRNKGRRKEKLLSLYKPYSKVIVFDTETTGLSKNAKIIQFSAVEYFINEDLTLSEMSVMDVYINPQETLRDEITDLTGITQEMVDNAENENTVAQSIFDFLSDTDFIAAYNTPFDISKLEGMSDRTNITFYQKPSIDVCELARDMIYKKDIEKHELGLVSEYLFPEDDHKFHNSLEDVRATAKILEAFVKMYVEFEESGDKLPAHLEKAHLFINPKRQSMQRINLKLSVGDDGDIFYDIKQHYWSCKSTAKAKKMFSQLDLASVENQVYKKYIDPFSYSSIDEMASGWMKFRREKLKELDSSGKRLKKDREEEEESA